MAKYSIEDTTLTAIADTIRAQGADAGRTIGQETPLNFPVVIDVVCGDQHSKGWNEGKIVGEQLGYGEGYDDGEEDGYTIGYDEGIDVGYASGVPVGIQSEYDRFWDAFQQHGNRTIYTTSFGSGWTADIFKPKYPIRPINAYMMFFNNLGQRVEIPDFVDFCVDNNIILDFSNCVQGMYALGTLWTNHHGVLDFSNCTNTNYLFYSQNQVPDLGIKTIDEFISSEITVYSNTTFQGAIALKNITFSGVIASSIWFDTCTKLTKESIISIFGALSTTATGKTLTLSMTAVDKAFETSPGANDGRSSEELFLIANDRLNWMISSI